MARLSISAAFGSSSCRAAKAWSTGLFNPVMRTAGAEPLTKCVEAADVLDLKFVSPPLTALVERLPIDCDDEVKVAIPPLAVPVPIELEPSKEVTAPVGEPLASDDSLIVAVGVTAWPDVVGLAGKSECGCSAGLVDRLDDSR